MKFANIFTSSLVSKYGYSENDLLANAEMVNKGYDVNYLEAVLSNELKQRIEDDNVEICLIHEDDHYTIFPEGTVLLRRGVSAMFTTVDEKPYILINTMLFDAPVSFMETALKHELVHFKQWAEQRLSFVDEGIVWEGELYTYEYITSNTEDYNTQWRSLPWETEAYANMFSDEEFSEMLINETPSARAKIVELLTLANKTHLIK